MKDVQALNLSDGLDEDKVAIYLWPTSSQAVELIRSQSGLPLYAAHGSDCHFPMVRHNHSTDSVICHFGVLDVAAFLTDLREPCRLEFSGDLSIRKWPDWRQPLPQPGKSAE